MIPGRETCAGRSKETKLVGRKHLDRMEEHAEVPCFQKEELRQCWDAGCEISAQSLSDPLSGNNERITGRDCGVPSLRFAPHILAREGSVSGH